LSAHFEAEGEAFLSQIVTADETRIHHFEPETQSIHGRTPFSVSLEKKLSLGKGMISLLGL